MPEMTFTVRWPDGATEDCYSPSLVMHDHLSVGESYTLAEFVLRVGTGLDLASARVAQRYGFACTSAAAQKAAIERAAGRYAAVAGAVPGAVEVLAMCPPLPASLPAP